MTDSTSTRFDIVNRVLRMVGERPVELTDSSSTITKCEEAIKNALSDIQGLADWTFLRVFTGADSWNNEEATLERCNKLYHISYTYPVGGSYVIPQIQTVDFYRYGFTSFPSSGQSYPSYFAVKDDKVYLFNPYPETVEDRARVVFHYQVNLEFPSLPGGFFNMPERFISLLCYKAAYHMALTHLADMESANSFLTLFGTQATVQLARDSVISPQNANMFRQRGYRGKWL